MRQGFYHGVSGLITQPTLGFRNSGSKGLVKGVGKGVGGVFFKPTAGKNMSPMWHTGVVNKIRIGLLGLVGFPLDGLQKNVRSSLSKSKSKEIIQSRITQGIEEMCTASSEEQNRVIQRWHELHSSIS